MPTNTGSRGSICADRESNVYLILPGNTDSSLSIVRGLKDDDYTLLKTIWTGYGFDGEPSVDVQRLELHNELSVFTRTADDDKGGRNVVVLDFSLDTLTD